MKRKKQNTSIQKIKRRMKEKNENINFNKEISNINKRRKKEIKENKKQIKNLKDYEKTIGLNKAKRRIQYLLYFVIIIWIGLACRVAWIQFGMSRRLKTEAYTSQVLNRNVTPKRGTIYDATGKNVLAVSSSVETVTVTPVNIEENNKEKVARILSEVLEVDYDKVLKKVNKKTSIEIIAKKLEKDKTDELRERLKIEGIESGINIDEDSKRFYPYDTLASNIIGFCGSDNQGLDGIEAIYDSQLKGECGKIQKQVNAVGKDLENVKENFIDPVDGNDLVLTIDATIQGIAEKYLEEACIDNKCTDGGNILIENPKTGDILAIASCPNYSLNNPYEINQEELKQIWDVLSSSEKSGYLQQMWRNKAVSDAYEPGSTFKLVTASAAIEEGITSTDNVGEFCCTGGIEIAGVRIKCWRYYRPHGSESLRDALMNSCNPVFIALGQKIGVEKYYSYLKKFGLLDKTGIDLPGEGVSIFLNEKKVGPVELATISFGQRFEITPIQMISAVSTIANKGIHVKPRIVKEIHNKKNNEIEKIEPVYGERVISESTANSVLSMMGTVVEIGTGKNARVQGYSIGGKTGTSEDGVNTGKYVTSFVGLSPVEDPQVVILILLYNPSGEGGHQGGAVAAPIASKVLGEVLPYLEVEKTIVEENEMEIEVPNFINMTYLEAKEKAEELGIQLEIKKEYESEKKQDEKMISYQYPVSGVVIKKKVKVTIEIK